MIRNSGYGPKLVREFNELNILKLVKNKGPMSRAELAKRYKISKATVSEIIAFLIQQGFIKEKGIGDSTSLGGRKPIMLEFNPKSGYAIGIEIKRDHARVALSDLNAQLSNAVDLSFIKGTPLRSILKDIFDVIDTFKNQRWVKKSRPLGIGVAIPGLIDYKSGCVQESDTLKKWQEYPIRDAFEKRYGIQTVIENDVKAITLGEFRFGNGKSYEDIIYLWIGDGIGAGIIINGELYRGVSASAGEVGYYEIGCFIQSSDEFKLLYEGHKNFGDILSGQTLVNGAFKGLHLGYESNLDKKTLCVQNIFEYAEKHDPLAMELIKEYAILVGILCINLINTLNPELILIGGHPKAHHRLLLRYIREKIKKDVLHTPIHAVRIKDAKLRENAGVLGAVGLILDDLFYADRLNVERYRNVFRNALL
jgi:predicted NBD/HSP70 family sugar kinase